MSEELCRRLGVENSEHIQRALTHRSFSEEAKQASNNERLEYLGDAVLELTVTELLFRLLPDADEGNLSRARSHLVRTESLAEVGLSWDVGPHLRLGRGEESTGGRTKPSLLANTVEALLGALYLDQGYPVCLGLIEKAFGPRIRGIEDPSVFGADPKSLLQDLTMARWKLLPTYRIVSREGPSHEAVFHCELRVGEHLSSKGSGTSKKNAQRAAAQAALESLDES